ncbi:MAG: non-ribosomal peptide synthetase, partial [bacterium]|nr:non-ribosomal peptide synthetase [bacterium]
LYRTGDLARLLPDGNIAFSGRMDDQVKIRGFRVEPGEVTTHLTDHEDIKDAVVTVWESSPGSKEDKYLCAYIVSDREIPVEQLRESLSEKLPRHMIPSYFVQVEEIPLTGNGKVDRRALPEPGAKPGGSDTGYTAPRDEMEIKLAALWREILRTDQLHTPREIGIDDDFFDMGGHSLKAVELVSRLHKELNVKISLTEIFRLTTIRRLSQYLTGTAGGGENRADRYTAVQPVEKRDYYALSSAQERMYILQRMALENIAYNIPAIFPLEEKPETAGLETVFKKLIDRHESLRTSFHMVDNQPVQKIHHDVEFKIETPIVRTEQCSVPTFINDFVRFFDLSAAPLLRVGVLKTGEGKYSLMVDIHHIISDGVSQEILAREFTSLYKGETLPPLRIQYKDFTHWQNSRRRGDAMKRQEEYWLNTFKGGVPLLNIPTDYPRPPVQDFQGDSLFFKMDPGLTAGVKELTAATGTTLFMVSLAAYYILLSKYTAQEDIVVGVPVSGRSHADLQNVIGMFVNTLALRNHPRNESTFREFLEELKENTLHAFENQDYPFESLVEALEIENDPGRQPLVDAVFTLQNVDVFNAGAQSDPSAAEIKIAKFDLQLAAVVRGDEIELIFDYRRKLFKKETIGQMSRHFLNIIVEAAGNPGVKLLDIEMIKKEEEQELIKMIKNGPAAQLGTTVTKKIEAEFDF